MGADLSAQARSSGRSERTATGCVTGRRSASSIRENIADIIAEESIIGRDGDRIVKVPIRGVKEYRFVYGDNQSGVGEGAGESTKRGDVVGERGKQNGHGRPGEPGERTAVPTTTRPTSRSKSSSTSCSRISSYRTSNASSSPRSSRCG